MFQKIKDKWGLLAIGYWLLVIGFLIYTRLVGLDWGLPYPMHPDERNMAVAVQQLECKLPKIKLNFPTSISEIWSPMNDWVKILEPFDISNCFNPHFFAYGQFPLYLAYGIVWAIREIGGGMIGFKEATLALRVISAIASIISSIIVIKIIKIITGKKEKIWWWIPVIFSPFFIQFAHFGTTESFLMLFYTTIIYLSLLFIENKISLLLFVVNSAIILGVSMATKVSSLVFAGLPLIIIIFRQEKKFSRLYSFLSKIFDAFILILIASLVFIVFSPHNLLNFKDFFASLQYESDVALGRYIVFYTQQFYKSLPVVFQIIKIFPFTLGLLGIFGLVSFFFFNKNKYLNLLKISFLIYFFPNVFVFTKWSRFMAPIFPILLIFGIFFLERINVIKIIKVITVIISILPGIFYLSVYQKPDIRFQATDWINKNIPKNSYVLSETANVVDIPLENKNNLNIISFNFYDLDENQILQEELKKHLEKADYIFVPSRRIFANYTCFYPDKKNIFDFLVYEKDRCIKLKEKYPRLNEYYEKLFNGDLGFRQVAVFGDRYFQFEEMAEETVTVFDHPVIRIYKRIKTD